MHRGLAFSFCAVLVTCMAFGLNTSVQAQGGHYGIPAGIDGCQVCHGTYPGTFPGLPLQPLPGENIWWIPITISWTGPYGPHGPFGPVKFTTLIWDPVTMGSDADGTLADKQDYGPGEDVDGPCEVCHTLTDYYRNDGTSPLGEHYPPTNLPNRYCIPCHPHFDVTANWFEPRMGASHGTHFSDLKGPCLGDDNCGACHLQVGETYDYEQFWDSQDLQNTTVCDECHSQGGTFDGVGKLGPPEDLDYPKWVAYGAKYNWAGGVYDEDALKSGKEDWCAGCHDYVPSIVKKGGGSGGVPAPNTMGDESGTYGYKFTGHGKEGTNCLDCHNSTDIHIDDEPRTYGNPGPDHTQSYRLKTYMEVPRVSGDFPDDQLCFDCHVHKMIFDTTWPYYGTNFREDRPRLEYQGHELHLRLWGAYLMWDSDFDGDIDSGLSCTACHNPMGSSTPAMIRNGELIGYPSALDFRWYEEDGITPTTEIENSRWGDMRGGSLWQNHVCQGCHAGPGEGPRLIYHRVPFTGEAVAVVIEKMWASDLNNVVKTHFTPNDDIRYHVQFKVYGPADNYYMRANGTVFQLSGNVWGDTFVKGMDKPPGTHKYQWARKVDPNATPGSSARVRIRVRMFDYQGGTQLDVDVRGKNFHINE